MSKSSLIWKGQHAEVYIVGRCPTCNKLARTPDIADDSAKFIEVVARQAGEDAEWCECNDPKEKAPEPMPDLLTPNELERFASTLSVWIGKPLGVEEMLRKAAATMRRQSNDLVDLQRRAASIEARMTKLEIRVLDVLEKLLP